VEPAQALVTGSRQRDLQLVAIGGERRHDCSRRAWRRCGNGLVPNGRGRRAGLVTFTIVEFGRVQRRAACGARRAACGAIARRNFNSVRT
jgi:hypothetical protein